MDEKSLWLSWTRVPGIGARRWTELLRVVGTAGHLAGLPKLERKMLLKKLSWPQEVRRALEEVIEHPSPPGNEELARAGITSLIIPEEGYPPPLMHLLDPPPVLYFRGTMPSVWANALAIVGTRRPTPTGERVAFLLARQAALAGYLVVSGLARGIDAAAHRGAMSVEGGKTAAVLGHGLHHLYPPEHRELAEEISHRGLLLTEFTPETIPRAGHFPVRNRIIAALSRLVVVVEAGEKSGALITARYSLELGREVMAVPGDITRWQSRGPNLLIKDGAGVIVSPDDFFAYLSGQRYEANRNFCEAEMGGREEGTGARIMAELQAGPLTAEVLAVRLGLSPADLWREVTILELKGRLKRNEAGLYYLKHDVQQ